MAHIAGTTSVLVAPHRLRAAFTLIELMVVVSVLALLVLMLMPALQKALEAGRIANCSANLRAQGLAWRCYLSDNKETFPLPARNMDTGYGGKQPSICEAPEKGQFSTPMPMTRPLNPYLLTVNYFERPDGKGGTKVVPVVDQAPHFRCPSDHGNQALDIRSSTYGNTCYDWLGNSYRGNWLLMVDTDPLTYRSVVDQSGKSCPFRLPMVKVSPSVVILAGDAPWFQSVCDVRVVWSVFHSSDDRVNLLFLDGHVKYTRIQRGIAVTGEYSQLPYPEVKQSP